MLQQFPPTPKGCSLNIVCQFLSYSEILDSKNKMNKENNSDSANKIEIDKSDSGRFRLKKASL